MADAPKRRPLKSSRACDEEQSWHRPRSWPMEKADHGMSIPCFLLSQLISGILPYRIGVADVIKQIGCSGPLDWPMFHCANQGNTLRNPLRHCQLHDLSGRLPEVVHVGCREPPPDPRGRNHSAIPDRGIGRTPEKAPQLAGFF